MLMWKKDSNKESRFLNFLMKSLADRLALYLFPNLSWKVLLRSAP